MAGSGKRWNKFQRLRIRPGEFSEHARRAESATVRHAHRFIVKRVKNAREVRRNIAIWLIGMGALIGLATVQFFLYQASYSDQVGVEGGTYAEGVRSDISTLNPLYAQTIGDTAAARLMFSSLFTHDSTGAIKGDLAERYTVHDEGRRYRISLKPQVYWHDNKRLTADDVIYTVNLMKDPSSRIALSASWESIEVKKVDERTVDFVLPAVYAPFPSALTFYVVPEHILGELNPSEIRDSNFSRRPTGSGPFSFNMRQDLDTGDAYTVLHLNRNKNYYRGAPKVERFQLHTYATNDSLARALRSRAVNAVGGLSSSVYAQFKDSEGYVAKSQPVHSGVYALFNTRAAAPLGDSDVRKALQLGTDTKEAIATLPSKVRALDTPILPDQTDLAGIEKPGMDYGRAETLLDEAGWKKNSKGVRQKDDTELHLKVVSIQDADYDPVVANLAKQWRALGVDVTVRTVDTSDPTQNLANTVLQPRDFDVLVHELYLGSDPDVYAYWHSSQATERGLNFSSYRNGVSDDALLSARLRTEGDLRAEKYKSFVRQWYRDAPAIGLYQSQLTYVHTDRLTSFDPRSELVTSHDRYNDVIYWTAEKGAVYKTP